MMSLYRSVGSVADSIVSSFPASKFRLYSVVGLTESLFGQVGVRLAAVVNPSVHRSGPEDDALL